MSIKTLQKLLGSRSKNFSEEKLEEIRHDIYQFVNITFDIHQQNPGIFDKCK